MIEFFKKDKDIARVINIPLSMIRPNPNQPRKTFDESGLEELSLSIAENGVLQPISVRKIRDYYEIIAGERRYRASKIVGRTTIPAIIVDADANKSALIALLENLQREDLSFFEVADAYQRLIREQGITQEELARKLGKSQSNIANKLRLLRFSPRLRMLISDYSLTERHARSLLHLPGEDEQLEAAKQIHSKRLNVAQTEDMIKNMLKAEPKKKMKISVHQDIRLLTNTLKRAVSIMQQNGVDTELNETDYDWGKEYVIRVRKQDTGRQKL